MPAVFDPASPSFAEIVAAIHASAIERDLNRMSIKESVAALQALGIGAARIPRELGGAGLSITALFDVVFTLAKADSNVAHVLRNHFQFVEGLIRPDLVPGNRALIARVVAGELFSTSYNENSAAAAGAASFDVTLKPADSGFRIDGDKAYSTGNLYVDNLIVTATDPSGANVNALIPVDRDGIEHLDNWDGIGQRLSGSGTTRYRDVRVRPEEVLTNPTGARTRPYGSTFSQLWLTTVVAGILQRALADVIDVVHARRRNYYHGLAEQPAQDPLVQQTLGQLAAHAHVPEVSVRDAAVRLEKAFVSGGGYGNDIEPAKEASLAALKSKIVVDGLAQWLTSELFELGGASGTARAKALDRHWRNARTLSSHNPSAYKARVLGDHLLNGVAPPDGAFF